MVDVLVLDRLRTVGPRKRWLVGLAVGSRCQTIRASLVGVEGAGLSSRVEIAAQARLATSTEARRLYWRLRHHRGSLADAVLLSALLAETQAALVDAFAGEIAPVWDRILAVAVDDPGLWHHAAEWSGVLGLCDAARLAELTGHNVIDAFAARDLAQGGRGHPLACLPHWILMHDVLKTRVLVQIGRAIRLTYLAGSRDASGAHRLQYGKTKSVIARRHGVESDPARIPDALAACILTQLPQMPRVDELVLFGGGKCRELLASQLAERLPNVQVLQAAELGILPGCRKAAVVALLGLLHLDQVPGNVSAITGARVSRVLGRLTPGSLANWHRLIRELAAAKPTVVALRSAV